MPGVNGEQGQEGRRGNEHIGIEGQSMPKPAVKEGGQSPDTSTSGARGKMKEMSPNADVRPVREGLGRYKAERRDDGR